MSNKKEVKNFKLKDQDGNEFELYENMDKNILLIFYPRDNSKVCSMQLQNYQFNEKLFNVKNIRLIGINTGNVDSHKRFCEEKNITFPLLNDKDKKVSKYFGALNILGFNKRKLVLINTDKKVIFEMDVPYSSYPDYNELLNNFDSLKIH